MAPKLTKLQRLSRLAEFVHEPSKLAELRNREGSSLREKLRQLNPEERTWYQFLLRNVFVGDEKVALAELNATVLSPPEARPELEKHASKTSRASGGYFFQKRPHSPDRSAHSRSPSEGSSSTVIQPTRNIICKFSLQSLSAKKTC